MRHAPSSQVNAPAPAPESPLPAAAGRLLSALADVLEIARDEGLEAPVKLMGELGYWALGQRCLVPCANCDTLTFAPDNGVQLCPGCRALILPASSRKEAS